jgi:hypothetical protein
VAGILSVPLRVHLNARKATIITALLLLICLPSDKGISKIS